MSSSSSGFSKSSTVGLWVFSLTGPKRDRMVSSHSRLPDLLSLGASGGVVGFLLDWARTERGSARAGVRCAPGLAPSALLPSRDAMVAG